MALILAAAMAPRLAVAGTLAERWSVVLDDSPPQELAEATSTITKLATIPDGGIVALRNFDLDGTPAGFQLVRLTAAGAKLWHWSGYGVAVGLDLVAVPGGGLSLAVRSWRAGKAQYELWLFDDAGKLVWRRDVPIPPNDDMWLTATVVPQADGGLLFLGRDGSNRTEEPLAFDYASNGEIRWSLPPDAVAGGTAVDGVHDGDGFLIRIDSLAAAVQSVDQKSETSRTRLVSIGADGRELGRAEMDFRKCAWGLAAVDGAGLEFSFDPCLAAAASDAAAVWIDRPQGRGQAPLRIRLPIADPHTDCLLVLGTRVTGSFFGDGAGMAKHRSTHGSCDLMIVRSDASQAQTATIDLTAPARWITGVMDSSGHVAFVAGNSEQRSVVQAFDLPH
jgi:hypothetical protein